MIWLIAAASAQKAPTPWVKKFYWQPRLNVRAYSNNGRIAAQALGGAEVGFRYTHARIENKRRGSPDLVGRTRLRGDVLYGLLSRSLGFDLRLGSFIGPTSKYVTYQVGPDFWTNLYGRPGTANDYHLPWSVGVEVPNTVIFHVIPQVSAQIGVIPGWAFTKNRQVGRIGPFHELGMFVAVNVRVKGFQLTVGYQRTYNAAGTTDGLILSGGM